MAESADNKAFVDEDNVKIFESKVVPLSASVDKDTESTKSTKSSKSEQKNDETNPPAHHRYHSYHSTNTHQLPKKYC